MLVPYKHTNMARGQCPAPTGPPRGGSAASEGSKAKLESPRRVRNGTVSNIRTHREKQRWKEKLGWGSMNLCHWRSNGTRNPGAMLDPTGSLTIDLPGKSCVSPAHPGERSGLLCKKQKQKPLTHLVSLSGPQIQALSETLKRKRTETAFLLKEEGGNQPVWSQHKTP